MPNYYPVTTEISAFLEPFFKSAKPRITDGQGGGFAATLTAENLATDKTPMAGAASGGSTGSPILKGDFWARQWTESVDNAAEKMGIGTDELKEKFEAFVERAKNENGFSDPKAYLKSLSVDERKFLQNAGHYGTELTDSHIESMTEEGASNMMVPKAVQRDYTGDGLVDVGTGTGGRFPTDGTSDAVKKAWAEMTKGMSDSELLMAGARMAMGSGLAAQNAKEAGVEYADPYADPSFSFSTWVKDRLAFNEQIRAIRGEDQYQETKDFWTKFSTALDKYDAG